MKKILIGVIAVVAIVVFVVPLALEIFTKEKVDVSLTDQINQNRLDIAVSVNAEKGRVFIEKRILGIAYLESVYASDTSKLPTEFRDRALDDQKLLSDTKTSLEGVITFLNQGDIEAANAAYQLIQNKTIEAKLTSAQRSKKIKNDFKSALRAFYKNGVVYQEDEWERLKQGIRTNLIDRNTDLARKAYLMQPADNLQISYLLEQLQALGEQEQLLFFYQMNYEISYRLLKNYGSLSAALDYGIALHGLAKQSERAITVLKGPVTQIMSDPNVDVSRYVTVLNTYLNALEKQGKSQDFEQFSQVVIDSVKNKITVLDAQLPNTSNNQVMEHLIKADFRTVGADSLYKLNFVDEAILLVKDARIIYAKVDQKKAAKMDSLIQHYQKKLKQE